MEKKIFKNISLLWIGMLFLIMLLFTSIVYNTLLGWTFQELEEKTLLVRQSMEKMGPSYLQEMQATDRWTWIAADGTVLYDNLFDVTEMGNHAERQEVREALQTGHGQAVHYSDMLMKNTL